ncbi:MAG: hypothetical protein WCO83_14285 [Alphaproteobacteria bacterium]
MDRAKRTLGVWRSVALALSVLAIALKSLTPSGFMLADQGSGFPLVICTGQGPLVIADHGDQKAPAHKTSETPCAFAGLGTPLAPEPMGQIAAISPIELHAILQTPWIDHRPERRLAAPPPQSHAPPALSELI